VVKTLAAFRLRRSGRNPTTADGAAENEGGTGSIFTGAFAKVEASLSRRTRSPPARRAGSSGAVAVGCPSSLLLYLVHCRPAGPARHLLQETLPRADQRLRSKIGSGVPVVFIN
jgi:hypothetical protein